MAAFLAENLAFYKLFVDSDPMGDNARPFTHFLAFSRFIEKFIEKTIRLPHYGLVWSLRLSAFRVSANRIALITLDDTNCLIRVDRYKQVYSAL